MPSPVGDEIQVLRARAATWADQNPVLLYGEHGYEKETGKFKIGDGQSRWTQLDYFIPEASVLAAIQAALDALGAGGGDIDMVALTAHVNSLTPHPTYDDGPSLELLYQNAKV